METDKVNDQMKTCNKNWFKRKKCNFEIIEGFTHDIIFFDN